MDAASVIVAATHSVSKGFQNLGLQPQSFDLAIKEGPDLSFAIFHPKLDSNTRASESKSASLRSFNSRQLDGKILDDQDCIAANHPPKSDSVDRDAAVPSLQTVAVPSLQEVAAAYVTEKPAAFRQKKIQPLDRAIELQPFDLASRYKGHIACSRPSALDRDFLPGSESKSYCDPSDS